MTTASRARRWSLCALGILGLAGAGVVLTGRAPHVTIMRGGGPLAFALLAAAETAFVGALIGAPRWRTGGAIRALLLAATIAATGVATAIVLGQMRPDGGEFRLSEPTLDTTQRLLVVGLLGLAALWLWPGVDDALVAARADGVRGRRLVLTLLRHATRRLLVPLKAPAANLALTLGTIILGLLVAEAAMRILQGAPLLEFENQVTRRTDLIGVQRANRFDPLLGWVLADNQEDGGAGDFSTGAYGVRMNGRAIVPVPHHAILASGDSFTVGSEVRNAESWPAQLEAMLGEPVVNAATGAWGTDQIILRAESLIPVLEPKTIIVSFLADDILRAANATYGGGNKPYFTVEAGALVAHNHPVPRYTGQVRELGWLRGIFGYSHLAGAIVQVTGAYEWWFGGVYRRIDNDPSDVTCLLLQRLKATTDAAGIALNLVMQYGANFVVPQTVEPGFATRVVACARAAAIPTINTWAPLRAIQLRDPQELKTIYNMLQDGRQFGHMSPAGNRLVARLIADALRR
jgi:hypothetical protein